MLSSNRRRYRYRHGDNLLSQYRNVKRQRAVERDLMRDAAAPPIIRPPDAERERPVVPVSFMGTGWRAALLIHPG